MPVDNSVENTIEVTERGGYIYMGRLKMESSNGVLATKVWVVSENVLSRLWLTPLLGSWRVGVFLSETASWIIAGGVR